VDLGLLNIKNIDLPEKLKRNTKPNKVRENKRILGTSIEERPKDVKNRLEFGHWEIDTMVGSKNKNEPVSMTLVERKTRYAIWIVAKKVFLSITDDNGSEFARLNKLESDEIKVYFAHPYSSWKKDTNEYHNRMFKRFIPKGKNLCDYKTNDTLDLINSLPRKILGYRTPDELFEKQLDEIYAA